jgi:hypothetical protein
MTLTDTFCRNRKPNGKPQKFADGGGLYLFVTPAGGKVWRMDYRFLGKRKTLAFGPYPLISLVEARSKRGAAKKELIENRDPSVVKENSKRAAKLSADNSFEKVAREWLENQLDHWTPKYAEHVKRRLEADIFGAFGDRPISEIEPLEVWTLSGRWKHVGPSISRSGCAKPAARFSDML